MPQIEYHRILARIMLNARKIASEPSSIVSCPFTAERFIAAVIDYVSNENGDEYDAECSARLRSLLVNGFNLPADDLRALKTVLLQYISANIDNNDPNIAYTGKLLKAAQEEAAMNGCGLLMPEDLLRVILRDPSPFISAVRAIVAEALIRHGAGEALEINKKDFDANAFLAASRPICGPQQSAAEDLRAEAKRAIIGLTDHVKGLHDRLSSSIFGQENAIGVFTTGYFQAELMRITDKNRTRPRATFLFAGPPGVGKTLLAQKAAEELKLPFHRFDMSEYCDKEASIEFIGSDAVYRGSKGGNFTEFVEANPRCIVLLDEIEKAHISIIHLFLQILDAGIIRDSKSDRVISLKDVILIFTTNAGRHLYEDSPTGNFSGVSRKVILKALESDINPQTQQPYFPAAICSRFASGNVVMFNYIAAHDLRKIAKKEFLRQAEIFREEIGLDISVDERVYTALLLSESGSIDARTMQSRAEAFFDNELYELFRLLPYSGGPGLEALNRVNIEVDLDNCGDEIRGLFDRTDKPRVLTVSSKKVSDICAKACSEARFVNAGSIEKVRGVFKKSEISFALIDMSLGNRGRSKLLNLQDVDSTARDIYWYIRENYSDLPIYVLNNEDSELNAEERRSFLGQGVRGFIALSSDPDLLGGRLRELLDIIHWQNSVDTLARANKLLTFETSQSIDADGKTATIKLFDFEQMTAVDAQDAENIIGSVSRPEVTFDMVIGAEDAKKELKHFVDYLKNPRKYRGTGLSAPKGVILYGPPGTGKTTLAKAMAHESGVTFIATEGNRFMGKHIGDGAASVHKIFAMARKYAPAILFVDEIDAVAKERRGADGAIDVEAALNAFLAELDGFKTDHSRPVFVLAATNFDVESGSSKSLDSALMRRFDRRILIDLPNHDERKRYLVMKTKGNDAFDISAKMIESVAMRSSGMSPASLESVLELSLRMAFRDGNTKVTDRVLEDAFETFTAGEVVQWDAATLERTARHEAGHALLCWLSGETPSYLTIVARSSHGGYMQHGSEGKYVYTKQELLARIRTSFGGRAAEIVYYGAEEGLSTGARSDLQSATMLATHLICSYGMEEGFGLAVIDPQAAKLGELSTEVRTAVNRILDEEMKKAIALLEANKGALDELVKTLLVQNRMTGEEIKALLDGKC